MTTALIPPGCPVLDTLNRISAASIAAPTAITADATGSTLTWTPDLSPADATTVGNIVAAERSATGLSAVDYAAVRAQMQILRDLRQLGRNAFVAQTQAQINRSLYDSTIAITEIFLKLFRDP